MGTINRDHVQGYTNPFAGILENLPQKGKYLAGLKSLQQMVNERLVKGYLSESDIEFLQTQIGVILTAPDLSDADKKLLNDFMDDLDTALKEHTEEMTTDGKLTLTPDLITSLKTLSTRFKEIYDAITSPEKGLIESLFNLQTRTDTIMKQETITQSDVEFLKHQGNLIAPYLLPPNLHQLKDFLGNLDNIFKMTGGGGRLPIGQGKNAFLNCSAILQLFIMTSEVIGLLSKIQLMENLYKAKLALVMKDMASASYRATIEAGKAESLKELAQAAKAAVDMGLAIGQMFIAITMYTATQVETKRAEMSMRSEAKMGTKQPLTAEQRTTITSQVDQKMRPMQSMLDGLIQALKSSAEFAMHTELSKLDIEAAVQRATSELLNKLMDIISQSVSMLSKSADTDVPKSIQSMMEQMTTALRTYGEAWSKG